MKTARATQRKSKARKTRKKRISDKEFETRKRALHALARMRQHKLSLVAASREEGTTPATVKRYFRAALRRTKGGKWIVSKSDRYVRILRLPDVYGPTTVKAKGYAEAQLASAYLASLTRWARTEKAYELAPFHGKKVGGFELITATRTLRALRDAGLLQLDSLYAALKDTV
jgi:hypothetical protein